MPERFEPQTGRNATDLGLYKAVIANVRNNENAGTTIPMIANGVPVSLPPLSSILIILTMPRIIAIIPAMGKRPPKNPSRDDAIGRERMLKKPSTNDTIANLLGLTFISPVAFRTCANTELQDWHS
jgi:hypothetical protein